MSASRQVIAIGLLLASVSMADAAESRSIELVGAWATDADQCAKVFNRKGDRITFSENPDLYGGGFVIEQDRIAGRSGHCTIASRKWDGDVLHLLAACSTEIMFSKVQFSLKVVDDNTVIRLFPGMPDVSMRYQRCRL